MTMGEEGLKETPEMPLTNEHKKLKTSSERKKNVNKSLRGKRVMNYLEENSPTFTNQLEGNEKIDKEKLKKYNRGNIIDHKMIKVKTDKKRIMKKEGKVTYAMNQSVRSELLLTEEPGYIEPGENGIVSEYMQSDIKEAVDMTSASKRFDLHLKDFGPYMMNYTRNGRFLLLGGRKGHVAAMDWISKKLLCEFNVMDSVYDVQWLHQETLYAVAQKKWTYIYDNQGIEIHCIKQLNNIVKLWFLPYHFLLSAVSSTGFISWLDITVGKIISNLKIRIHHNPATVAQHNGNALIGIGQSSGIVNFWSPNDKRPLITKLCHKQALCALAFDPKGETMATASIDKTLKLWDARNLDGPIQQYSLSYAPNWISLSQRGYMALGMGNIIEIYKDCASGHETGKDLYLRHSALSPIKNIEFCPYEDILGIAHSTGFSSILVPGSGEPNFDALEANPFQTKSQRREAEIQKILNKIPHELITWDPADLRKVHIPSLEEIIEEKKKLGFIKPPDIKIEPRYKMGKKTGSVNASKRKKIMKEEYRRNHFKMVKNMKSDEVTQKEPEPKKRKRTSVLDRFKPKALK